MFQYYKKLLFSNIAFYALEQSGGSPEERQETSDLQVKIEVAKKELVKLGKTPEVAELEKAVKEIAGKSRTEAGKLLLDTIVENHFSQNPNNTSGEFQTQNSAVDFDGENSFWDTRVLQAEDVIALEKYGITQEQVISALNAHIPTQKTENAYAQYRSSRKEGEEIVANKRRNAAYKEYADSRSSSDQAVYMASLEPMGDGKAMEETAARTKGEKNTVDAYSQYADSRQEGEKIVADKKISHTYSEYADSRKEGEKVLTATTQLADLLEGGEIKFSELKRNPAAVEAAQITLTSLGFNSAENQDGVYGPQTEKAVAAFQKSLGGKINVDGDAGTATLTALLEKTKSLPQNTETLMADTPQLEDETEASV